MAKNFDVSGENLLWYGRLQLLFRCTLCPARAFQASQRHVEVSLAFFSTFEPVESTRDSVMQRQGVPMFYDSALRQAAGLRLLRGHSQSIHLPRQEYPGPRSYDTMLRGRQHATHHPLSLQYSTGAFRMVCRHEARRQQRQPRLRAQSVDVALWPGAGAQDFGSARHGDAGENHSRGASKGQRDCQAQAAGGEGGRCRRRCGCGAVNAAPDV